MRTDRQKRKQWYPGEGPHEARTNRIYINPLAPFVFDIDQVDGDRFSRMFPTGTGRLLASIDNEMIELSIRMRPRRGGAEFGPTPGRQGAD
jgi:hypothetical protein